MAAEKHARRRDDGKLLGIPLHGAAILFVAVVCFVLVSLDAAQMLHARSVNLRQARDSAGSVARSVAQQAQDMVQTVDIVLLGVAGQVLAAEDGDLSAHQPGRGLLDRTMAMPLHRLPMLNGLLVLDSGGDTRAEAGIAGQSGVAARLAKQALDYHREHDDRELHIGPPIWSDVNSEWYFSMSRRVENPGRHFLGVVVAVLPTRFLQKFYQSINMGVNGSISLVLTDGHVVARDPAAPGIIGHDISRSGLFLQAAKNGPTGTFERRSSLDGVLRIGQFVRVDGYNLIAFATFDREQLLSHWRDNLDLHVFGMALVLGSIIAMGVILARQIRQHARVEAQYRLLADYSTDAIARIALDGTCDYVSPAFLAMTGWNALELTGRSIMDIVHPDDRENLGGILRQASSLASSVACRYRHIGLNGAALWVESRFRFAPPVHENQPGAFIANIRDISRQKMLEDKLASANAELTVQSVTDSLTAVANRRSFDETLSREWRRGLRERTPLALLLIDIDQFKGFNDHYGHAQGDDCLRLVAAAIRGQIKRTTDLVARYGGEEFGVVLPSTDARGAWQLAEDIRQAIRGLSYPHEAGSNGIVTVSIGVASIVPDILEQAGDLLRRADMALYRAKRQGRDRVEVFGSEQAVIAADPVAESECQVLVLEEADLVRLTLMRMIEDGGLTVCGAQQGQDALAMLDRLSCRVLITDVVPATDNATPDGRDVALEAMRRFPDLYVIYTSTLPIELGRPLTDREGILRKPYSQSTVLALLDTMFSREMPA